MIAAVVMIAVAFLLFGYGVAWLVCLPPREGTRPSR